jgi:hypothetical protein
MLTNIWNKYLPVIKILLKRSNKQGEQLLAINQSDFEKAGLARKSGNKFSLQFKRGKVDNVVIPSPVAAELANGLLQNEDTKALLAEHDYRIALDSKYQLHIVPLDAEDDPKATSLHVSHA